MKPPSANVPVWAWLAYAASTAGLLVLAVLPAHKYAWLEAVDPSTNPAALEDASGNRYIFATLVMLLALGAQVLWLLKARRTHGRGHIVAPCVLIAAVLVLWGLKF